MLNEDGNMDWLWKIEEYERWIDKTVLPRVHLPEMRM